MPRKYLPWPRPRMAVARAHDVLLKLRSDGSLYGVFPVNMAELEGILAMHFMPADAVHRIVGGEPIEDALCMRYSGVTVAVIPSDGNTGRIVFHGAHEAGHVACGHFEEFDVPWLREKAPISRAAARTLASLDREADVFATELLMPLAVVRHLKLTVEELQYYHCVSYTAAAGRLRDLDDPAWAEYTRYDEERVLAHCSEYIEMVEVLRAMR